MYLKIITRIFHFQHRRYADIAHLDDVTHAYNVWLAAIRAHDLTKMVVSMLLAPCHARYVEYFIERFIKEPNTTRGGAPENRTPIVTVQV